MQQAADPGLRVVHRNGDAGAEREGRQHLSRRASHPAFRHAYDDLFHRPLRSAGFR